MFPCFFGAFKTFSQFSAVAFRNLGQIWISQNLKQYVTPLGTMYKLKITRAPKNLWTACNKNSKNYICPSVELSNLDATENMTRPPLQFWSATSRWSPGTVFGRWDNWFFLIWRLQIFPTAQFEEAGILQAHAMIKALAMWKKLQVPASCCSQATQ